MKYLFLLLIFIHGAIHLIGFTKGLKTIEPKQFYQIFTRIPNLFWLLSFLFFAMAAIFNFLSNDSWLLFAVIALIFSTLLIISEWKEAKYGMIPNVIILAVVIQQLFSGIQLSF